MRHHNAQHGESQRTADQPVVDPYYGQREQYGYDGEYQSYHAKIVQTAVLHLGPDRRQRLKTHSASRP